MKKIILGIGAGRDGTTTLAKLIEKIFAENNYSGKSTHQRDHAFLYNQLCLYKSTNKQQYLEKMREAIRSWKLGDAIVGNGYAFCLDLIYEIHGEKISIIHLKRRKEEWVKSFIKNIKTFPRSHGNYSKHKNPKIHRIAAYHFNEMNAHEWNLLPLEKKVEWYYHKTHSLIESSKFKNILNVNTENLSEISTVKMITEFINPNWSAPATGLKVNVSKLDYETLNDNERIIVNRMYNAFDYVEAAKNPIYGEKYFANKVIDGFIHRNEFEHSTISENDLIKYEQELSERLVKIRNLLKNI